MGKVIWAGSEVAELFTLAKSFDDLEMGDPSGVITSSIGIIGDLAKLPPIFGVIPSAIDLLYNLSLGLTPDY